MEPNNVTWRELLEDVMSHYKGESIAGLEHITLSDEELDVAFDAGWGGTEGKPFYAWSKNRVYFPATYDGSEWVSSVPRNPSDENPGHVGG